MAWIEAGPFLCPGSVSTDYTGPPDSPDSDLTRELAEQHAGGRSLRRVRL
jgi:hypothetical protein